MDNNSLYGLEYLTNLSYAAIDRSDLNQEEKRNLLFCVYRFRSLFDNLEIIRASKILFKYKCCFYFDLSEHPFYNDRVEEFDEIEKTHKQEAYGGLYINIGKEDKPQYKLKVDANTELWRAMVKSGKINGVGAQFIEQYSLYEMVYNLITLPTQPQVLDSGAQPTQPQDLDSSAQPTQPQGLGFTAQPLMDAFNSTDKAKLHNEFNKASNSLTNAKGNILTIDTMNELRSMWYIFFPYIVLCEAPFERDIYCELYAQLVLEENFRNVLNCRYSDAIADTTVGLHEGDPILVDWYHPYIEFKNVKCENGRTREVDRYYKLLAKRDYEYVIKGCEKLLNSFPFDEDILILHIAALVSSCENKTLVNRNSRLSSALDTIDNLLPTAKNHVYLYYYKGLTYIGQEKIIDAIDCFEEAINRDPKFELAQLMLRALTDTSWKTTNLS